MAACRALIFLPLVPPAVASPSHGGSIRRYAPLFTAQCHAALTPSELLMARYREHAEC